MEGVHASTRRRRRRRRRCDAPHALRSAYAGWAALALLLYVIGIPAALLHELHVSPLCAVWAALAAITSAAAGQGQELPRSLRVAWRAAVGGAAGLLLACMTVHALLGHAVWVLWTLARLLAARVWAVCDGGHGQRASELGAALRGRNADLLGALTSPSGASAAVRSWCRVPVGPFKDDPASRVEVSDPVALGVADVVAGALVRGYTRPARSWELVIVLRKLAMLLPRMLVAPYPAAEAMLTLFVLVLAGALQVGAPAPAPAAHACRMVPNPRPRARVGAAVCGALRVLGGERPRVRVASRNGPVPTRRHALPRRVALCADRRRHRRYHRLHHRRVHRRLRGARAHARV